MVVITCLSQSHGHQIVYSVASGRTRSVCNIFLIQWLRAGYRSNPFACKMAILPRFDRLTQTFSSHSNCEKSFRMYKISNIKRGDRNGTISFVVWALSNLSFSGQSGQTERAVSFLFGPEGSYCRWSLFILLHQPSPKSSCFEDSFCVRFWILTSLNASSPRNQPRTPPDSPPTRIQTLPICPYSYTYVHIYTYNLFLFI